MSYHHFKGQDLSRSEKVQRYVVKAITNSNVPDYERENSIVWELKHSSSCIQIGRILAEKRGLDVRIAEVICALHDIYAIKTGKYKNHAEKGAEMAREILLEIGDFSTEEIDLICRAIRHHSEKHIYTDDPWIEFMKDADSLDCCLYEGVTEYYKEAKTPEVRKEYFKRFNKLRKEIGLEEKEEFKV